MPQKDTMTKGFRQRLADNDVILLANGYLFEMERRGYLAFGSNVPEVVLEHPEALIQLTNDFVRAGTNIVMAFTYYGHRAKLKDIGREDDLEALNKNALKIARDIADKNSLLMAGDLSNTNVYDPANQESFEETRNMFKEQIEWAVQGGADLIVAETFGFYGEAKLALECIKEYGNGLPSIILFTTNPTGKLHDGMSYAVACRQIEELGADVVGINCSTGPTMMVEIIKSVKSVCKGPLAVLPCPYRTSTESPTFHVLTLPNGNPAYLKDLDYFSSPQSEIEEFGTQCRMLGIQLVGVCCGNTPRYFRALAEAFGRNPQASKYSTNMQMNSVVGKVGTGVRKGSIYHEIQNSYTMDPNASSQ